MPLKTFAWKVINQQKKMFLHKYKKFMSCFQLFFMFYQNFSGGKFSGKVNK